MNRTSTEEEILSYVSKKLATAQLSQRRPHNAPGKRLPAQPSRSSSRVVKPSSRHVSPKLHDKSLTLLTSAQHDFANVNNSSLVNSHTRPRNGMSLRPVRPLTWHTTAVNTNDTWPAPNPADQAMNRSNSSSQWQNSSYDWPGDIEQYQGATQHSMAYPSAAYLYQQSYASAPQTSSVDFPASSYFPWSQSLYDPTHAAITGGNPSMYDDNFSNAYSAGGNMLPAPSSYPFTQFDNGLVIIPRSKSHRTQNSQSQPPAKVKKLQQNKKAGVELFGLGLYNKTEDASPSALCAGLPPTFVPNGSYGIVENVQNSAETWAHVPDWQYSDSPEGSEASHSPFDCIHSQGGMIGQPNLASSYGYDPSLSSHPQMFGGGETWYMDETKQSSYATADVGDYQWIDPMTYTSHTH